MSFQLTLIIAIGVSAVVMFNLFSPSIATILVFIGGVILARWITRTDPAYLRTWFARLSNTKAATTQRDGPSPNIEIHDPQTDQVLERLGFGYTVDHQRSP